MVTSLVAGFTRTRIIDWVSTWSELNFESSSDPRRRTVNAPCETAIGDAEGEGENRMLVGDGEAMVTAWPVSWSAVAAAGRKYANPPATAERATASTTRVMVVKGLRRPRDLRARCPGLIPSGTGKHSTPGCGLAL